MKEEEGRTQGVGKGRKGEGNKGRDKGRGNEVLEKGRRRELGSGRKKRRGNGKFEQEREKELLV